MVLTMNQANRGAEDLLVRILADTMCQPHGAVHAGQIVSVTRGEYHALRAAHKAELAPAEALPSAADLDQVDEEQRAKAATAGTAEVEPRRKGKR